jgi:hypothetical protein
LLFCCATWEKNAAPPREQSNHLVPLHGGGATATTESLGTGNLLVNGGFGIVTAVPNAAAPLTLTGTGAMTLDETALLADGAVLVSAASGDHEFPVVHTQAGRAQGASRDHTAMKDWQGLFDQAADELRAKQAGQPAKPIVTTTTLRAGRATTSSSDGGVTSAKPEGSGGAMTMRFPLGDGTTTKATATLPWDGTRHGNFVFDAGPRRFMVLRGGTPVNLGRDLPPDAIQLTRSMLFAACVQAVGETTPGWVTFSPAVQASIEEHWRSLQR